jgi:hypothetical protein
MPGYVNVTPGGPCQLVSPHEPHGNCPGSAPEFPWEPVRKFYPCCPCCVVHEPGFAHDEPCANPQSHPEGE